MQKVKEGYKMTELGEIPNQWEVKNLCDVTQIIMGQSPDSSSYNEDGEGIPFFQGKTEFGYINPIVKKWCSEPTKVAEPLDILISVRAPVGAVNINNIKSCIGRGLGAIRQTDKSYYKYIFYALQVFQNELRKSSQGSTFEAINSSDLKGLKIPLPEVGEQQKISLILTYVDEQIEITDNLIGKAKELKKGLMQKLLTKGIGHSRFKDTEIGKIPEEWELRRLGDICDFRQGFQISRSEQITEQQEGYIRYLYITDFFSDKNKLYVKDDEKFYYIENEDITIANTGNTCGKAFRGTSGVLSNNMFKIFNKKELLDNEFLWQYLNSLIYWEQLKKYFNTAGQPHVGHKNMSELKIALPNNTYEQQKISLILLSVDEQIEQYESKKEKLQELKKGLMQRLLTGSIRVKI